MDWESWARRFETASGVGEFEALFESDRRAREVARGALS